MFSIRNSALTLASIALVATLAVSPSVAQNAKTVNEYTKPQNTRAPGGVKPTPGEASKVDALPKNEYTKSQSPQAPAGKKPTVSGAKKIDAMKDNEYTKAQDIKSKQDK